MVSYNFLIFLLYLSVYVTVTVGDEVKEEIIRNYTEINNTDIYKSDTAKVLVYYETLCPYCKQFFMDQLEPVTLQMAEYMDIQLIPYGHATTTKQDDKYVFTCQHGPNECYGNMLHACAIDALRNNTLSALFAACLMHHGTSGSDREALKACGSAMNIETEAILECTRSNQGRELLKAYGDVTAKLDPIGVPAILLNNILNENAVSNLLTEICKSLKNPPSNCTNIKVLT